VSTRAICEAIALGEQLWTHTHALKHSRDTIISELTEYAANEAGRREVEWAEFSARWFHNGLPRIVTGHKHAASLMATRVPLDAFDGFLMPWDAFVVDIPIGLLGVNDRVDAFEVRHVAVRSFDDEYRFFVCDERGYRWAVITQYPTPFADASELDAGSELLNRYIAGVLLELDTHRPASATVGAGECKRDPRGAPVTRTFVITRPVEVDCRAAVAAYARGERNNPLTVQSLIRGYWRMQPCGPRSSLRERRRIEPYWRGSFGAPLALRPHNLPDKDRK